MFYQKIAFAVTACALVSTLLDAARDWKTEAREPIHRTFASDKSLDVDNIDGTIQVIGDNGNTIRVDGEKVMRAADQGALDRARRDVTLDVNEKDGVAQLYVNGPFRDHDRASDNHGFHIHFDEHDYEVAYNFTIHVPRDTELRLRTVNGEVKTEQTSGRFDIHGVNGPVAMTAAAGSGTAKTVNGRLDIAFRENPKSTSNFETVNGVIEATFPSALAADLSFKTLNGQVFTDFDATALAGTPGSTDRRNGKFVYASNHRGSVRIGSGGPELTFQTLNGDIRIRKEAR